MNFRWVGAVGVMLVCWTGCGVKDPMRGEHRSPKTPSVVRMIPVPDRPLLQLVPVQLDGRDCWFLVDTGAPVTGMRADLTAGGSMSHAASAPGGERQTAPLPAGMVRVGQLRIGNHEFSQLPVRPVPASQLPSCEEVKIAGALGMNVLQAGRLGLDPGMGLFSLPHPGLHSEPIPLVGHSGAIWVDLALEGAAEPLRMKVDTGEDRSTLTAEELRRLRDSGVGGGATASGIRVTAKLGALARKDFLLRAGRENRLGMDFWSGHILVLDATGGQLWIGPKITQTDTTALGIGASEATGGAP